MTTLLYLLSNALNNDKLSTMNRAATTCTFTCRLNELRSNKFLTDFFERNIFLHRFLFMNWFSYV